MTTPEMITWFDILQDKFGSPYFTEAEKLLFLNRACFDYVKTVFPDNEGGVVNIERDWNILQNVAPLVFETAARTMDSSGKCLLKTGGSSVLDSLKTLSGDTTCDIFKILSVEFKKGADRYPAKFLRHNDKAEFENNYFKKPDFDNPKVLFQNGNLQFRPIDTTATIYVTAVKTPIILTTIVNCELPESTHNDIVALALSFAGVASRDEVLTTLNSGQQQK